RARPRAGPLPGCHRVVCSFRPTWLGANRLPDDRDATWDEIYRFQPQLWLIFVSVGLRRISATAKEFRVALSLFGKIERKPAHFSPRKVVFRAGLYLKLGSFTEAGFTFAARIWRRRGTANSRFSRIDSRRFQASNAFRACTRAIDCPIASGSSRCSRRPC